MTEIKKARDERLIGFLNLIMADPNITEEELNTVYDDCMEITKSIIIDSIKLDREAVIDEIEPLFRMYKNGEFSACEGCETPCSFDEGMLECFKRQVADSILALQENK